jgi:NodT family efflux transporter outer membrane factor (OMF) lipoprotein
VQALAQAGLHGVGWVRRVVRPIAAIAVVASSLAFFLSACALGPDYKPAAAPVPTKFKELKGWKVATPSDALDRGDWWRIYRDKRLDVLMRQVEISNQNVAVQAAAYEQARALIREAQASLFPVLTGSYSATRTRTGPGVSGSSGSGFSAGGGGGSGGGGRYATTYTPSLSGSWDLDVWGKVRRQIESNTAAAQASAADLANVKLSQQSLLATAYFNLLATDALHDVLARTVEEYKRTLQIVQNQFNAGYSVTSGDVATARAQLETAQAQEINTGVLRAQFEDAIAMLIGRPPAELTVGHHDLIGTPPRVPVTIPSTLLERRPDIAQAERTMQQENALIGVAEAAFFPDISLSGVLQWIGKNPLPFTAANEVWSLGAAASQPIFDGGLRSAQLDAARAAYWQSVATYRQTVLTAFQGVEDQLAAVRLLAQQLTIQEAAVKDARTAVNVFLNQFQAGTVAFTTVVTAEIILLGDEETELTARQNLFLASVTLIEDLGGTWDTTLLPTQKELQASFSLLPQLPTH